MKKERNTVADSTPPAGTVFEMLAWSHDLQWKAGPGVTSMVVGLRLQAGG